MVSEKNGGWDVMFPTKSNGFIVDMGLLVSCYCLSEWHNQQDDCMVVPVPTGRDFIFSVLICSYFNFRVLWLMKYGTARKFSRLLGCESFTLVVEGTMSDNIVQLKVVGCANSTIVSFRIAVGLWWWHIPRQWEVPQDITTTIGVDDEMMIVTMRLMTAMSSGHWLWHPA